ncbi:PEGA domain-containing protein [Lujinxingia litoralis]|uniref:PEGA domain-containing protein n=1 Tax=Lujinxingia litoralis TaxID=2211119 RepID=UPI0013140923|nr:PEGA domain-containing protein [Lujinxingia litoralis]
MVFKHASAIAALTLLLTFSHSVSAQQPVTKQELTEADLSTLVNLAREAYEAGEYEVAIERLLLANRREPDPRLLINVARSYAQADNCALSLVYYAAFVRHPAAQEPLIASAQAALDEGKADCPAYTDELGGRIMFESEPMFARVYIDDTFIGTTPTESAGLAPGTYQVRMELDDHQDFTQELEVVAQQDATIGAIMETPSAEVSESDSLPDATEAPADEAQAPVNYFAYGLVGAGALALGNGLVFDLVVIPGIDEERRQLSPDQTDEYAELTSRRQSRANIAIGSYVAGAVLITGGVAWLVYDYMSAGAGSDNSQQDDIQRRLGSIQVAPALGQGVAGVVLGGRF